MTKQPAVSERFYAWRFGPVLDSVYREFRHFGSAPVTDYAVEFDPVSRANIAYIVGDDAKDGKSFNETLQRVLTSYGHLNGLQLSALSHAAGSPWALTAQSAVIEDKDIQRYFESLSAAVMR